MYENYSNAYNQKIALDIAIGIYKREYCEEGKKYMVAILLAGNKCMFPLKNHKKRHKPFRGC